MELNWVLIAVIVVLAGYTLTGYVKGFLKIVYSLVSWLVIVIVVVCAAPVIQDYLKNDTDIYYKLVAYCEETIREKTEQEIGDKTAGNVLTENELYTAILEKLPENLVKNLQAQASDVTDKVIEDYGLYQKAAVAAADLLLQGIATLAAMIAGVIVSILLSAVLGFVAKLPLIGFANSALGLAAGAVNGLLVVWIVFYLTAVLCTTELGSSIAAQIYANGFLTYLYENNPVLLLLAAV